MLGASNPHKFHNNSKCPGCGDGILSTIPKFCFWCEVGIDKDIATLGWKGHVSRALKNFLHLKFLPGCGELVWAMQYATKSGDYDKWGRFGRHLRTENERRTL